MKSRLLHIASSVFLIGTLLFAQIGVNFFHRNHDVHENKAVAKPLKSGEAGIQKHDEHCKVCSIDFFNHAFVSSEVLFVDHLFSNDSQRDVVAFIGYSFHSFSQDRAPPVLS